MTQVPRRSSVDRGGPRPRPARLAGHLALGGLLNLASLAGIVAGAAAARLGLRRAPDPWRRTIALALRSEGTRFGLSSFGLRVPPDVGDLRSDAEARRRLALRLAEVLDREPAAKHRLRYDPACVERESVEALEVAVLEFEEDGSMASLDVVAPPGRSDPCERVPAAPVMEACNRARHLPERVRPRRILDDLRRWIASPASDGRGGSDPDERVRRILGACCLSFEDCPDDDRSGRFLPPDFRFRRPLGLGALNLVARVAPSGREIDLWVSVHHSASDGAPIQELLGSLEAAWGVSGTARFPEPLETGPAMGPRRCSFPGEREIDEIVDFVDLSPVQMLRRRLQVELGREVPFVFLLGLCLGREPELAGLKIATTADVPASGPLDRAVDFVPVRPMNGRGSRDTRSALMARAAEYSRLLSAARSRTSPTRRAMMALSLLPARLAQLYVSRMRRIILRTYGSLGLTVLRDASVFTAPMSDSGFDHGFFAIGSASLPTASGRPVAAVSFKGPSGRIDGYPALLRRALDRAKGPIEAWLG